MSPSLAAHRLSPIARQLPLSLATQRLLLIALRLSLIAFHLSPPFSFTTLGGWCLCYRLSCTAYRFLHSLVSLNWVQR
ncbi:hypothetical protein Hanom_Chr07g00615151 [Helianthus anomalus]